MSYYRALDTIFPSVLDFKIISTLIRSYLTPQQNEKVIERMQHLQLSFPKSL